MDQLGLFKKLIGILTVVSLVLFGAIYFVYSDIKNKNEKILAVEHNLSFKSSEYDYLVSMRNFIKNSEVEIGKINNSIIPNGRDVDFIENLENRGKNRNLKIEIQSLNLVSNDTKTASSSVATLKVKARAEGSWSNIYSYVSEVESLPYKVKITKLSLNSNVNEVLAGAVATEDSKNWHATFEISALKYQK